MPRHLPWASKGGGSRTQVKQPRKPAERTSHVASDDDDEDDFFDGTILASTSKGKRKALFESDEDASDLLGEASTARTKRRIKDIVGTGRAPSSSPPPIADLYQPRVEPMRKGVSKFDLRDDEWMMVEDEFLETAKLFTRHLHMAEYDRLKEIIEAKKKEAEISRPVIAGAKPSVEGAVRAKVKAQEKKQVRAIQDVFATQNHNDKPNSKRPNFSSTRSTVLDQPAHLQTNRDTDSEDLDAPRRPQQPVTHMTTIRETPAPTHSVTTNPKSNSLQHPRFTSSSSSSAFINHVPPSLGAKSRAAASRTSRPTPFDMLDEYVPRLNQSATAPVQREMKNSRSFFQSPLPTQPSRTLNVQSDRNLSPGRSLDLFEDWGSGKGKAVADRLAKRKSEREKDAKEKEKRKAVKLDDIPTFLF